MKSVTIAIWAAGTTTTLAFGSRFSDYIHLPIIGKLDPTICVAAFCIGGLLSIMSVIRMRREERARI